MWVSRSCWNARPDPPLTAAPALPLLCLCSNNTFYLPDPLYCCCCPLPSPPLASLGPQAAGVTVSPWPSNSQQVRSRTPPCSKDTDVAVMRTKGDATQRRETPDPIIIKEKKILSFEFELHEVEEGWILYAHFDLASLDTKLKILSVRFRSEGNEVGGFFVRIR
ncbi:hypothetical protein E2C01_003367 [Portunus trituberculatus]|uniref:Uncharacterized protein n=1 Tax=Portunus trituberculatus TaxID=210409 RepID=A0A5B7CNP4_PORTR|nr:hypothetical protein [Portunus trituberculatus]